MGEEVSGQHYIIVLRFPSQRVDEIMERTRAKAAEMDLMVSINKHYTIQVANLHIPIRVLVTTVSTSHRWKKICS